ncbi:hypothetical protein [Pusillimonas sp. ANT_WB101]|uniref:hypothetical protein n=1 Tax=Pusillimonas sp. ANT_WB101 TaxID=2597356 RepID=UPI0011F031C0|nr:hypothetical protein [Pusillimonas sp. ANT_WB101]KAA0910812.1 hypothetical protein FQ179_02755 [Pusillimonas sp. ANT_WB101]
MEIFEPLIVGDFIRCFYEPDDDREKELFLSMADVSRFEVALGGGLFCVVVRGEKEEEALRCAQYPNVGDAAEGMRKLVYALAA